MNKTSSPSVLALIPARGGSKGILRKNIRLVAGKPLIAWTIEAAMHSAQLDRVIVTTDDEEIATISREYGAEVPFMRPEFLSQDKSTSVDVIIHALQWLQINQNYCPNLIMLLQPTSPLRTTADIDAAIQRLHEKQAASIIGVCKAHPHPYWTKKVDIDDKLDDFINGSNVYTQRQELPVAYAINGAIYLIWSEQFIAHKTFHTAPSYAYCMPQNRSLDIDTEWDLQVADFTLRALT
ncbi:MAG: acylneuraminate cytidylyltransferase family protein [Chloroflexi bacterium]|nr:acylneuraminate cytidylyltransferase family protein [Chloroflexota bacterium]